MKVAKGLKLFIANLTRPASCEHGAHWEVKGMCFFCRRKVKHQDNITVEKKVA